MYYTYCLLSFFSVHSNTLKKKPIISVGTFTLKIILRVIVIHKASLRFFLIFFQYMYYVNFEPN